MFQNDVLLCYPFPDLLFHQIAHFAELGKLLCFGAFELYRVFEGPVHSCVDAGPYRRAVPVGIITDGDQILEQHLSKLRVDAFGGLIRNIDPHFVHHFYCEGIHALWLQTRAVRLECLASIFAQKSFCYLAAC